MSDAIIMWVGSISSKIVIVKTVDDITHNTISIIVGGDVKMTLEADPLILGQETWH